MLARNEPRKRMRKVGMRKVGRWIDAGMCNATVNRFGLGSDRREWCCRCRREWFRAIANGSHRREWVWVQIVAKGLDRRREGFKPSSRMVRSRREWFGAVAKCSELSRMVRTVAIDFSPQIVANRSEPSRMVQTVANSYRRRFRSYRRRWGSPATVFGSEATGFGSDGNWVCVSEK